MKSLRQLKDDCPDTPEKAYYYWKDVLRNLSGYSGWSIEEFENRINKAIRTLRYLSKNLDKHSKNADILKTLGGAASFGAGIMAIANSNTRASSKMTVGAALLELAGAALTRHATRKKKRITSSRVEKADEKTNEAWDMITYLDDILSECEMQLKRYRQLQSSDSGRETFLDGKVYQYNKETSTAKQVVSVLKTGYTLVAGAKNIKCLLEVPRFTRAAENKAAGSTSADFFESVGIALGMWDCVEGALAIKNGSNEAKRLREEADFMEEEKNRLLQSLEQMRQL